VGNVADAVEDVVVEAERGEVLETGQVVDLLDALEGEAKAAMSGARSEATSRWG